MKIAENFKPTELSSGEMANINGGGWMAYTLGWIVGAMSKAGEGLEASGFNSAGANK
ncbi:MAG: hypothetical protein AAF433_17545 [Bacteroidota bacterium]